MTIEEIIQKEMTPRTKRFWGHDYENFTPKLAETTLGDGKRLMFFSPLNTRPNFYLIRIDSSHPNPNNDEEDQEFIESELITALEDEFDYKRDEDEDGNEIEDNREFPVLSLDCGYNWGYFDQDGNIID